MSAFTLKAHAAFFVDDAPTPDFASLGQPGPLLAIAGGIALAMLVWTMAARCADPRRDACAIGWLSERVSDRMWPFTEFVPVLARLALGGALVWCAAIGTLATPNLAVDGDAAGLTLRVAGSGCGLLLLTGIAVRGAAMSSIALLATGSVLHGTPLMVLERLDVVGLALFVTFVGGRRLDPRLDERTLDAVNAASRWLRCCVAAALLTVALTEKLANVPMTARVLEEHPRMNVGLLLGLDMPTTVLLLGAVEVCFAVLVLVLPLPELLALAIGAPFVLTVGEFGLLEVPGHLPVWGAVAVLALLGAHPQTADLLSARPPWLRTAPRTPEPARARIVGGRVPWRLEPAAPRPAAAPASSAPVAAPHVEAPVRIAVGGTHTLPATARADVPLPAGAMLPPAPVIAPQIAAWLAAPASGQPAQAAQPAQAHPAPRVDANADALPRFEWAARPGAGAPAAH